MGNDMGNVKKKWHVPAMPMSRMIFFSLEQVNRSMVHGEIKKSEKTAS